MAPELEAVARRWVALPGFVWVAGMRDPNGLRLVEVTDTHLRFHLVDDDPADHGWSRAPLTWFSRDEWRSWAIPDLDDDATFGLLIVAAYTARRANGRSAGFDFARVSRLDVAGWCVGLLEKGA